MEYEIITSAVVVITVVNFAVVIDVTIIFQQNTLNHLFKTFPGSKKKNFTWGNAEFYQKYSFTVTFYVFICIYAKPLA